MNSMAPSCGCRWGLSRSFSRVSRSTRRIDARTSRTRSRVRTLRWPSPWKGDSWMMMRRISTKRSSSLKPVLGPRRAGGRGHRGRRCRS